MDLAERNIYAPLCRPAPCHPRLEAQPRSHLPPKKLLAPKLVSRCSHERHQHWLAVPGAIAALRRTCLTWITRLGFGRDAMDRVANHRTSTVTDVYDRHGYADEDKRIMAAVARHVLSIVGGTSTGNVVNLR